MDDGMYGAEITDRWAANASQRTAINISKAVNEIIDPTEDNTFHLVMASG